MDFRFLILDFRWRFRSACLILTFLCFDTDAQNPIPAPAQSRSTLLIGGTAHIGEGTVIENSAIGFKDGKITFVGKASEVDKTSYQELKDISGQQVYPGMISPNTTLGLVEIEAVRATLDMRDVGSFNPNLRSLIAYNADNKIGPTARTNGVLLAQVCPRGGVVSGTSSVMMLEGWNWDDAVLAADDGVHMNWPQVYSRIRAGEERGNFEKNKTYGKQKDELLEFFRNAKAYCDAQGNPEKNLRYEAMRGVFSGSQRLYIRANNVKQITEAVNFAEGMGIPHMVLVGGNDSWMVASLLAEKQIPVIVTRLHELPEKAEDDVDLPYKLPYLLQKAGVLFCLNDEGDMEAANTRNLPFYGGTAAAYGLSKEQALAALTSSTAKILGIDKTVGTLAAGKDATLFVSTGDALDMRTNNVTLAFIRGKNIRLDNEQKALYEKYKTRYGIK